MKEKAEAMQRELLGKFGDIDLSRLGFAASRYGLEALGIGGRRLAVGLDSGRVAKIAFKREGLVDNEIEWRLFSEAESDLRELLCPALSLTQSGALIQARCLPSAQYDARLVRQLAQYGISDAAINLGVYQGRMVCYDYCLLRPEKLREIISDENDKVLRLDSLG